METLQGLKRSISSIQDLRSVVKTMKALAAVNIRQYQEAVESLRDYWKTVETGFGYLLRSHPAAGSHRGQGIHGSGYAAVVFGSDQGMCGRLNEDTADHSLAAFGKYGEEGWILAVGTRMAGRLEAEGVLPEKTLDVPGSVDRVTPSVEEILFTLDSWRDKGVDLVELHFTRYKTGGGGSPTTQRLLPLDRDWLESLYRRAPSTKTLPHHTMDVEPLFSSLVREHLFVSLFQAFCESLASENAARLASMQGAERNIDGQLDDLNGRYHQRRQMTITEELLDIVTGFEALKEEDDEEDEAA